MAKPMRRNHLAVKEVMRYRRKPRPVPFREIARRMNADIKSVYRWYRYGVGSYPLPSA